MSEICSVCGESLLDCPEEKHRREIEQMSPQEVKTLSEAMKSCTPVMGLVEMFGEPRFRCEKCNKDYNSWIIGPMADTFGPPTNCRCGQVLISLEKV